MRLIPLFNAILRSVLNANGNRITNVGEPTEDNDAATKKYVSDHAGEPADYSTVRDNAATGAAHAAERGNPHKASFADLEGKPDIPEVVDPPDATREGQAADAMATQLYLGQQFSYIQNIGVNLNEHIEDDGIHFTNETEKAEFADKYTKAEVDEKVGGMQERLTDEQLGNIANVPNKRDLTDNICVKDGLGEWVFTGDGVDKSRNYSIRIEKTGLIEIVYIYRLYADGTEIGLNTIESGTEDLLDVFFTVRDPEGGEFTKEVAASRSIVAQSGEPYVTPTGVANLTPDIDTSLTTSGAAADAKAVGDRLDRIERTANPNMNVVGNPVFKEGNVSGFSATDYMVFPSSVSVGQHSVVFDLAFQTGANVTTQQNILDSNKGLAFAIRSGKFVTAISTDGASWHGESVGGDVGANTAYKVRMTFAYVDGKYETKTFVEVGGAFVEIGSGFSTDAPVHATTTYWGGANPQGTAHVFGGSINLNECRLSFDGEEVWTGYDVLARNIVTFDQTKPSAEQLSTAEKILASATKLTPVKNAAGEIVGYTLGDTTTPKLITSDSLNAGVFATPAFKEAIGKKQDEITDLDNIRAGAGAGATALQEVPDLDASKIASGTLDASRIPSLDASKITSGTLSSSRIPSLAATKITSGTFNSARIPSLDAAKITSGTFDVLRIPSLDASKIASGTFAAALLPLATSAAKGAVMPAAKSDDMTQAVGVDSSGKLWTKPGEGGGGGGFTPTGHKFTWRGSCQLTSNYMVEVTAHFILTDGSVVSKHFENYSYWMPAAFTLDNVFCVVFEFENASHRSGSTGSRVVITYAGRSITSTKVVAHGNRGYYADTDARRMAVYEDTAETVVVFPTDDFELSYMPSYTCLDGSTLVTMADGTQRRIDTLHAGDKVLAYDAETNRLVEDELVFSDAEQFKTHTVRDTWMFEDGYSVMTIRDHELYCAESRGMKYMKDWKIGEHAVTLDGKRVALLSHTVEEGVFRHFKITGHHHNFFVNGLLNGDRHSKVRLEERG